MSRAKGGVSPSSFCHVSRQDSRTDADWRSTDGPDDPNILRGSCGLTYSLVRASPALEDGYKSYLPGRSSSLFNGAFTLFASRIRFGALCLNMRS